MKARAWFVMTLACFLAMGLAAPVMAAPGFYLGLGAGYAWPDMDTMKFDDNAGGTFEVKPDLQPAFAWNVLHLGYNFNDQWGLGFEAAANFGQDDNFDDDYVASHFTLSGRYTFTGVNSPLVPYVEVGGGFYLLEADPGNALDSLTLTGYGLRVAVGGQYFINNFYLAPELQYHLATLTDGTLHDEGFLLEDEDYDLDNEVNLSYVTLMVKVGYQWKK